MTPTDHPIWARTFACSTQTRSCIASCLTEYFPARSLIHLGTLSQVRLWRHTALDMFPRYRPVSMVDLHELVYKSLMLERCVELRLFKSLLRHHEVCGCSSFPRRCAGQRRNSCLERILQLFLHVGNLRSVYVGLGLGHFLDSQLIIVVGSWSNQIQPWQWYIHGSAATATYLGVSSSFKNPADTTDSQGLRTTIVRLPDVYV